MPVSKISTFGDEVRERRRVTMDRPALASGPGASFSSTGSPSTFQTRPSVTSPTGTEIGAPVSITSVPRAMPSVASIATARTRSSPRCCCTSAIRKLAVRARDAHRRVDLGKPVREDGVDDDALDLEQLAGLLAVGRHVSRAPELVKVRVVPAPGAEDARQQAGQAEISGMRLGTAL